MNDEIKSISEIKVQVGMDENKLPIEIRWDAQDGDMKNQVAKAMFLGMWDGEEKNTMKIDLWTMDMSIEEMQQFFHFTLLSMADTFERATNETNIIEDLRDYCYHFAEKMDILPEE